jgi:hypothetical protein
MQGAEAQHSTQAAALHLNSHLGPTAKRRRVNGHPSDTDVSQPFPLSHNGDLERELEMLERLEAEAAEAEAALEPTGWHLGEPALPVPICGGGAASFSADEEVAAGWWGGAADE